MEFMCVEYIGDNDSLTSLLPAGTYIDDMHNNRLIMRRIDFDFFRKQIENDISFNQHFPLLSK